jgi:hypothetical protein
MNFAISWVLGLFKKPQVEVTFEPEVAAWPFPVEQEKSKKQVKKPAIVKKRIALKKATTAAKKVK